MEPTSEPRGPKRSTGEWLFQLTTITLGVLIALSFDAVLRWNADRTLVNEARETIALEIAANRKEVETHLATFEERFARFDAVLRLMDELDAGVEPTVREIELGVAFPTLSSAAWEAAERTGALALMDYPEVQRLAESYTLQELVIDNVRAALSAVAHATIVFGSSGDPFTLPPKAREDLREDVRELRSKVFLDNEISRQLLATYTKNARGTAPAAAD